MHAELTVKESSQLFAFLSPHARRVEDIASHQWTICSLRIVTASWCSNVSLLLSRESIQFDDRQLVTFTRRRRRRRQGWSNSSIGDVCIKLNWEEQDLGLGYSSIVKEETCLDIQWLISWWRSCCSRYSPSHHQKASSRKWFTLSRWLFLSQVIDHRSSVSINHSDTAGVRQESVVFAWNNSIQDHLSLETIKQNKKPTNVYR